MLICLACKRVMAHINDNIKYDLCGTCLFFETEFISAEELLNPTTELTMVE